MGTAYIDVLLHNRREKDGIDRKKLLNFNVLIEQDGNLIAFAVPPAVDAVAIVDYLLKEKQKGYWGVQDGFIFETPENE